MEETNMLKKQQLDLLVTLSYSSYKIKKKT